MAPLPVIPFILTVMAAVNQKPLHRELSSLSGTSDVAVQVSQHCMINSLIQSTTSIIIAMIACLINQ